MKIGGEVLAAFTTDRTQIWKRFSPVLSLDFILTTTTTEEE